jgi:peptidoglycan/xylan/chitin deacetylase (PgdA/CDA1 family)
VVIVSRRNQLAWLADVSGTMRACERRAAWGGLLCLAYHRIGQPEAPFDADLWSASAETFDAQMRHLHRHFDIVSPSDLADLPRRARGRHVMVTFDDGYRDNYTTAFPILRAHGVPATFFVATGFIDRPRLAWWDEIAWMARTGPATLSDDEVRGELRRYKQLPHTQTAAFLNNLGAVTGTGRYSGAAPPTMWMTWDMVREMAAAGMTIGAHSVTHPVLARLTPAQQLTEVWNSLERIETEVGERPIAFSYPIGDRTAFDAETRAALAAVGVRYAFAMAGGFEPDPDAWQTLALRRAAVERDLTPSRFRGMLALPRIFACH